MQVTTAEDVFDSFESTFADKEIIPQGLELVWLLKAIGQYSVEIEPLDFDESEMVFDTKLDRYVIDTLGLYMKQFYQEREVSKVNKRASIVTKDFSWDGTNGTKSYEKLHLEYVDAQLNEMLDNLKPTAYV